MNPNVLIPTPDTIPAPAWIFIVLEQLLFLLHILMVNAVLGGALIAVVKRFRMNDAEYVPLYKPAAMKFPVLIALAINFAIPPLLFLQVVFGHMFYTSSVLMAFYWILIIPLLIIAYYGLYIHSMKMEFSPLFSKVSIVCSILIMLYIGFMLVMNNLLMVQPEKWNVYFQSRGGLILAFSDPTILPRYLHFIAASVAVGALLFAIIFHFKKSADEVKGYLRLFGIFTLIQVIVGCWYLFVIPSDFIKNFMGGDLLSTICLGIGFLFALMAIAVAFKGNLRATIFSLLITMIAMLIVRHNLRMMYLEDNFVTDQLVIVPQYGTLMLFIILLLLGLGAIAYMVKLGFSKTRVEAA